MSDRVVLEVDRRRAPHRRWLMAHHRSVVSGWVWVLIETVGIVGGGAALGLATLKAVDAFGLLSSAPSVQVRQAALAGVVGTVLAAVMSGVILFGLRRIRLRQTEGHSTYHAGHETIDIGPEGLRLKGRGYDIWMRWECVSSVRRARGGLLIALGPHHFIPLPAESVGDDIAIGELSERIRAWREAAARAEAAAGAGVAEAPGEDAGESDAAPQPQEARA